MELFKMNFLLVESENLFKLLIPPTFPFEILTFQCSSEDRRSVWGLVKLCAQLLQWITTPSHLQLTFLPGSKLSYLITPREEAGCCLTFTQNGVTKDSQNIWRE